jgi:hypothetical protein
MTTKTLLTPTEVWSAKIYSNGWKKPGLGTADVIEKATGAKLGEVGVASTEDVSAAAAAARKAQKEWAKLPGPNRGDVLREFSRLMHLGSDLHPTADQPVFRETVGGPEIQVHVRAEAPLVEDGSHLFANRNEGAARFAGDSLADHLAVDCADAFAVLSKDDAGFHHGLDSRRGCAVDCADLRRVDGGLGAEAARDRIGDLLLHAGLAGGD